MEEERIKKEKDDAKAIEMQRMKVYRETLDHQKQINEFNSGRLGTMTQVEKQFNKKDLRSYKNMENNIAGMVPGLNNLSSVGSAPMLRKAYDPTQNMPIDPASTNRYKTDLHTKTD